MPKNSLVSNYIVAQYKVHKTKSNNADIPNIVDRDFDNRNKLEVAVSDLTYIRVGSRWNYACTLIDSLTVKLSVMLLEKRKILDW